MDASRGAVCPSIQVTAAVWTIERMSPDDWDSVRRIYDEGLATRQATFETTAPAWDESRFPCVRQMHQGGNAGPQNPESD